MRSWVTAAAGNMAVDRWPPRPPPAYELSTFTEKSPTNAVGERWLLRPLLSSRYKSKENVPSRARKGCEYAGRSRDPELKAVRNGRCRFAPGRPVWLRQKSSAISKSGDSQDRWLLSGRLQSPSQRKVPFAKTGIVRGHPGCVPRDRTVTSCLVCVNLQRSDRKKKCSLVLGCCCPRRAHNPLLWSPSSHCPSPVPHPRLCLFSTSKHQCISQQMFSTENIGFFGVQVHFNAHTVNRKSALKKKHNVVDRFVIEIEKLGFSVSAHHLFSFIVNLNNISYLTDSKPASYRRSSSYRWSSKSPQSQSTKSKHLTQQRKSDSMTTTRRCLWRRVQGCVSHGTAPCLCCYCYWTPNSNIIFLEGKNSLFKSSAIKAPSTKCLFSGRRSWRTE